MESRNSPFGDMCLRSKISLEAGLPLLPNLLCVSVLSDKGQEKIDRITLVAQFETKI